MKVLLINGSPNEKKSVYTALQEVEKTLNNEGIETDIFWIGNKPISGCNSCMKCASIGKCVFNDKVNEFVEKAASYDGFIFGTPVYFSGVNGSMISFMDRVFFSSLLTKNFSFYLKPAAGIITLRRGGSSSTWDQLNKYFGIMQMPIVTSQYWNMVHGSSPEEIIRDLEGLQTMRTLAKNMSFMLKCKEIGLKNGVKFPEIEPQIMTNFIR